MYAPNEEPLRKDLWHELADNLDKNRQWIMAGDFNMVEESINRKGGSGRILRGAEKRASTMLKRKW